MLVHSAQALVDPRTEGFEVPLPDGGYRPAHDPETALGRAERALRESPDDPDLLEPIARVFYARGVLAGRVELIDRAIDLLERLYRDARCGGLMPAKSDDCLSYAGKMALGIDASKADQTYW